MQQCAKKNVEAGNAVDYRVALWHPGLGVANGRGKPVEKKRGEVSRDDISDFHRALFSRCLGWTKKNVKRLLVVTRGRKAPAAVIDRTKRYRWWNKNAFKNGILYARVLREFVNFSPDAVGVQHCCGNCCGILTYNETCTELHSFETIGREVNEKNVRAAGYVGRELCRHMMACNITTPDELRRFITDDLMHDECYCVQLNRRIELNDPQYNAYKLSAVVHACIDIFTAMMKERYAKRGDDYNDVVVVIDDDDDEEEGDDKFYDDDPNGSDDGEAPVSDTEEC